MTTIDTGHHGLLFSVTHDGIYRHTNTGNEDFRMPGHDLVNMAPLAVAGLARLDDTTVTTSQGVVSYWTLTGRGVRHVHRYLTAPRPSPAAGKVATFQRMLQLSPATVAEAVQAAAGPLHPPGTANRPAAAVESPARRAVHTGRSPQLASPRRSPPAGAPRR